MERIKNNGYDEVTKDRGILARQSVAIEAIINFRRRSAEILELFRDWLSKIRS